MGRSGRSGFFTALLAHLARPALRRPLSRHLSPLRHEEGHESVLLVPTASSCFCVVLGRSWSQRRGGRPARGGRRCQQTDSSTSHACARNKCTGPPTNTSASSGSNGVKPC